LHADDADVLSALQILKSQDLDLTLYIRLTSVPASCWRRPENTSVANGTHILVLVQTNVWHHVTGTYIDGAMQLYLDGVRVAAHSFTSASAAASTSVPTGHVSGFTIGGRNDPVSESAQGSGGGNFGYGYFHGLVDELRVWNDVRNAGQIMLDMLDNACGYKNEEGFLLAARDGDGVCLQLDPKLKGYWAFDETPTFNNATNNRLVRNRAALNLGSKQMAGAVSWSAQELLDGQTSYMDRTVTSQLQTAGSVSLQHLAGASARVTFSPGQQGSLTVTMIDPNPTDAISIADLPVFPIAGGIPQEASLGLPVLGDPAYCDGQPGCTTLRGSSVSRQLSWVPRLHAAWVVPEGGFPLMFQVTQTPTQPGDLRLAAPPVTYAYGPVYLDVQLPPEFVAPTPEATDTRPMNKTVYLGELVRITIKAVHRNRMQHVDIFVKDDPGLPNLADLSTPEETPATDLQPFSTTRIFTWTPQCEQAGLAKVHLMAVGREATALHATKEFEFNVVRPRPAVVGFDTSARTLRVGCPLELIVVGADSNQRPPSDADDEQDMTTSPNPNYLQTFEWHLTRVSAPVATHPSRPPLPLPGTAPSQVEELPLDFPVVHVEAPVANALDGLTSRFKWVPQRGQEGRVYQACVTVVDVCRAGEPVTKCVELTVCTATEGRDSREGDRDGDGEGEGEGEGKGEGMRLLFCVRLVRAD
jgi:hypothetical protein